MPAPAKKNSMTLLSSGPSSASLLSKKKSNSKQNTLRLSSSDSSDCDHNQIRPSTRLSRNSRSSFNLIDEYNINVIESDPDDSDARSIADSQTDLLENLQTNGNTVTKRDLTQTEREKLRNLVENTGNNLNTIGGMSTLDQVDRATLNLRMSQNNMSMNLQSILTNHGNPNPNNSNTVLTATTNNNLTTTTTNTPNSNSQNCLEWRNMNFQVNGKLILKNCYGKLRPGQVTALIGPSGAGKSTVMNLLAARQSWGVNHHNKDSVADICSKREREMMKQQGMMNRVKRISERFKDEGNKELYGKKKGTLSSKSVSNNNINSNSSTTKGVFFEADIRYVGKPCSFNDLKTSIAYVMQQDALLSTQSVYETLFFAAKLKLPSNTPKSKIEQNVEEVLRKMDLWNVRNVRIGDALVKGISGGQKKRVSAAIELLTRPTIMLLDEPTSGLDSFSSLKLIAELKNIAVEEQSIICATIHQPSSEIFDNFDTVICMRSGEVIFNGYSGKAAERYLNPFVHNLTVDMTNKINEQTLLSTLIQESIYTIPGFLKYIVQQPCPHGYNSCDWLLYLAQSMDDEHALETIEQCARAYELRNQGWTKNRVPLIEYRKPKLCKKEAQEEEKVEDINKIQNQSQNQDSRISESNLLSNIDYNLELPNCVMSIDKKNVYSINTIHTSNLTANRNSVNTQTSGANNNQNLNLKLLNVINEDPNDIRHSPRGKMSVDALFAEVEASHHQNKTSSTSVVPNLETIQDTNTNSNSNSNLASREVSEQILNSKSKTLSSSSRLSSRSSAAVHDDRKYFADSETEPVIDTNLRNTTNSNMEGKFKLNEADQDSSETEEKKCLVRKQSLQVYLANQEKDMNEKKTQSLNLGNSNDNTDSKLNYTTTNTQSSSSSLSLALDDKTLTNKSESRSLSMIKIDNDSPKTSPKFKKSDSNSDTDFNDNTLTTNLDRFGIIPDALKQKHLSSKYKSYSHLPSIKNSKLQLQRQKKQSWLFQLTMLTHREFLHKIRDPMSLVFRFIIPTFQVLLYAYGFKDVGMQVRSGRAVGANDNPKEIKEGMGYSIEQLNRYSSEQSNPGMVLNKEDWGAKIRELYGVIANVVWIVLFSSATGFMLSVPAERHIFLRESHANLYSSEAYLISKIILESILILLQSMWIMLFPYLFWGLNANFFLFTLIVFGMGLAGSSMGLLMATSTCNNPERALMLSPIFLSAIPNAFSGGFRAVSSILNVFSGGFRAVRDMPALLQPIAMFVPTTYGLRIIGFIETSAAESVQKHDLTTIESDEKITTMDQLTTTISDERRNMFVEIRSKWWHRHDIQTYEGGKWSPDKSKIETSAQEMMVQYILVFVGLILFFFVLSMGFYRYNSRTLYL